MARFYKKWFKKNNIKIIISGRLKNISSKISNILKKVQKKTKNNNKITVNLAINYGSKTEIIDAIKKINYNSQKMTVENINKNLYSNLVFPDILVRTGAQKRLSNFMLWQIAYAEIFFLDKLWPDFTKSDLKKIILKYHKIKRNFGGIWYEEWTFQKNFHFSISFANFILRNGIFRYLSYININIILLIVCLWNF